LSSAPKQNNFLTGVSLRSASVEAGFFLGGAPYPTALWSLDRRFCVFNPSASELLGYSEQEIAYHPELFLDRIHPDDRSVFLSAWQTLRGGEKSACCRYRFVPKHGIEARTIRENSLLVCMQDSDAQGVLTLYCEEQADGEGIADAYQLRSVLRGMTHEIGNNLQAISGELELLKWSGTLPIETAAVVSSAIAQIRALTGDVEEYFFPLRGKSEGSDLASIIANIVRDCGEKARANGIQIESTVNGTLSAVPVDGRFAKMLNAVIHFSCALLACGGELKIEAEACCRDDRHYIEVNVVSCCRAALPIEEDRVFRPFITIGSYRPGLSMTVAQRMLRRQSGKIVFRKEQMNRGVFSILIPIPNRTE
jgi:K+-sensing histidine kinase KdpD